MVDSKRIEIENRDRAQLAAWIQSPLTVNGPATDEHDDSPLARWVRGERI